jgi:dihydroorotate dehydrogenase electron transfer subunit
MTGIEQIGTIQINEAIAPSVYKMVLSTPDIAQQAVPGTFVHFGLTGGSSHILRRPISLAGADAAAGTITIIYRVVGEGTALMAALRPGDTMSCLGPLGHGFTVDDKPAVLVGGGVGVAPLLFLASQRKKENTTVIIGGKTAAELFWTDLFDGCTVVTTTDDGSAGHKGYAPDVLAKTVKASGAIRVCTCGPTVMVKKVAEIAAVCGISCEVSLEAYMGCGTGGCLGCVIDGRGGKRYKVCHDGPVFPAEEVFFHA